MEPLKKPLLCFYTLYHYINTRKEKSFESQSIEQMLKVILETNCSSVGDGGSGVEVHVRELPERNLRDSLNSISEESDLNKRLSFRGAEKRVSLGIPRNDVLSVVASDMKYLHSDCWLVYTSC